MRFSATLRYLLTATALLAATAAFAACGDSDDESSGGGSTASVPPEPKSGCGSAPIPSVKDPDGVIASLPASYKKNYDGYQPAVRKSPWSDWKPDHKGPYKVGVVFNPISNDFNVQVTETIEKHLKESPLISDVDIRATSEVSLPQSLVNLNDFIDQGVDVILLQPLIGAAYIKAIDRAAKKGIPVITFASDVQTPNAVNVQPNYYQGHVVAAARALRILGGKGNALMVHGVPGTEVDVVMQNAAKKAISLCPDVKILGDVAGNFVAAAAKSETLKFLATHPQKVDVVMESAAMAGGIMSAFDQTGRDMPVVLNNAPMKAGMGYWRNNSDYTTAGYLTGGVSGGYVLSDVALRMLEGQGIKLTDVTATPLQFDQANLNKWSDPSWNLSTAGQVRDTPEDWMTDSYLDGLFNNGSKPKTK